MSAFNPIPPRRAAQLLESADLGETAQVLVDFAAAGLVKGYARLLESVDHAGNRTEVRDRRIPREVWRRIAEAGSSEAVLSSSTIRLAATAQTGEPAITVTGIRFDDNSLRTLIGQHDGKARPAPAAQPFPVTAAMPEAVAACPTAEVGPTSPRTSACIPEGASTVTVATAMAATGLGRTTIDKLMKNGTLERVKVGRRTLITVASVTAATAAAGRDSAAHSA